MFFSNHIYIGQIVDHEPGRKGELRLANGQLTVKKRFGRVVLALSQLQRITGYSETTPGLEEVCCVDMLFDNGTVLYLNASHPGQQQFIDLILTTHLGLPAIKWSNVFCPFGAGKQVIYQRAVP